MTVITRAQGDTWTIPVEVNQVAGDTETDFTSLNDYEIEAVIRSRWSGPALWTGTKTGNRIEVTDAAAGELEVTVPAEDTASIGPGVYRFAVRLTNDGGATKVTPLYEAQLHVRRNAAVA